MSTETGPWLFLAGRRCARTISQAVVAPIPPSAHQIPSALPLACS
jgi:hypothetical protein